MKFKSILFIFGIIFGCGGAVHASEFFPYDTISLKITVIEKNEEQEWEFINPDEYEWEYGNTVVKDETAKREVEKMINKLNIHPKAKVEDMVKVLQENSYQDMQRLDIRWVNEKGELFTWVWEQE